VFPSGEKQIEFAQDTPANRSSSRPPAESRTTELSKPFETSFIPARDEIAEAVRPSVVQTRLRIVGLELSDPVQLHRRKVQQGKSARKTRQHPSGPARREAAQALRHWQASRATGGRIMPPERAPLDIGPKQAARFAIPYRAFPVKVLAIDCQRRNIHIPPPPSPHTGISDIRFWSNGFRFRR
jgi:hypothetical protein